MNTSTPQTDQLITLHTAEYDSLYEHIVKPDRALYISGYYARWIPYIGPDLAWLYIAFRQAAYMDGGRSGLNTSRISVAEIAARAAISKRTYQNRAADPVTWKKLDGLVTRVNEEPQWINTSGMPRQLPSQFEVAMTLPLTPIDSASLCKWSLNNVQKYGGVEGVLRAAAEAPLKELIPLNADVEGEPVTVRALIQNLFGDQLDTKLLDVLASAIQNHIMPSNDQIKISVFFMEHVLPYLGAGPGWVVTLMRDRCFESESETRNRVVVKGGYGEIASWLGINRVKTAWEWQHQKKDGKYINPIFNLYLRENVDERNYDNGDRTFHVLLEEIPFEMLEAFAMGQGLIAENADIERIGNFNLGLASDDAIFGPALAEFASQLGGFCTHVLAEFAPHFGASCTHELAEPAPHLGENCAVKALKPLTQTLKAPPTQPVEVEEKTPDPKPVVERESKSAATPAQSDGRVGWLFSEIAQNNSLNPRGRKDLLKFFPNVQELSQNFLNWILYAFSPMGKGLTDTTGVSRAVKSLCSKQPELAPQKFTRLTKLGPQKLQELFDRDYAREDLGKSIEADIYKTNFAKLDAERKADLYFRLFGKDNPEPAVQPQKREQAKTFLELQREKVRAEREAKKMVEVDV
jgi:hypothetical protein